MSTSSWEVASRRERGSNCASALGMKKGCSTARKCRCSGGLDSSGGRGCPGHRTGCWNVSGSRVTAAMSSYRVTSQPFCSGPPSLFWSATGQVSRSRACRTAGSAATSFVNEVLMSGSRVTDSLEGSVMIFSCESWPVLRNGGAHSELPQELRKNRGECQQQRQDVNGSREGTRALVYDTDEIRAEESGGVTQHVDHRHAD